ncbi:carboxylesterase [Xylariaceae sp. FL0016]|nr:carboxylesterase [Xylariaceae sp. FL0016]
MLATLGFAVVLVHLCLAQTLPAPVVDLGYAQYQGYYNSTYGQNIYRGIRYAAAPVGKLRWQLPQAPLENRTQVISATDFPPQCPQSGTGEVAPTEPAPSGNEDCLFLNVEAPANLTKDAKLPVLVYIHGGGYGAGNAQISWVELMETNNNAFLAVSIQYRLGAFGFLSSTEVAENGVLNVAIHDMQFALQWVQEYIHLFGGDPSQVTISGESAGGGSVMMLAMANGGSEKQANFTGAIADSPYLPTQWDYDGDWPTRYYHAFADEVGCSSTSNQTTFDCLVSADTVALQNASAWVSASALYGQWAFIPVTDFSLIQERPSQQLHFQGKVNGKRILTSNNGNEGVSFVPQNITSLDTFKDFVMTNYPNLSDQNMTRILNLYSVPANYSGLYVDSNGLRPPFSTTNSNWAIGWQQAANNLYAETTFVCPSYWLADAYSHDDECEGSWKYQYSVPPSQHGADVTPLITVLDTAATGTDAVFVEAYREIWGNFIVKGDPTLSTAQTSSPDGGDVSAAATGTWPKWGGEPGADALLNLNMTGGMPVTQTQTLDGKTIVLTSYVESTNSSYPPLEAVFNLAEGWSWEGGRGQRCQLWAELGKWAME